MIFFRNKYLSFNSCLEDSVCSLPLNGDNVDFVPQGLCFYDGKVIVSLYDCKKNNNSILLIFENNTCRRVFLDSKIHTGGICYYEKKDILYVTGKGYDNQSFIHRYCGKKVFEADNNSTVVVDKIYCVDKDCSLFSSSAKHSSPAYICCYDDCLYVGNYVNSNLIGKNIIKKFKILSDGSLSSTCDIIKNPYSNTQGIAITKYNNVEYFVFSRSFGRKRNSIINVSVLKDNKFVDKNILVLPSMLEQITFVDKKLYVLFESYAKKYRRGSINVNKDVLSLNFCDLLKCNDSFKDFCRGSGLFVKNSSISLESIDI